MSALANAWNTLCPLYLFIDPTVTAAPATTTAPPATTTPQKPIAQQYNEASKL